MNEHRISVAVLEVVRGHMRPGAVLDAEPGAMLLLDLGIDSMRLISMIVALEGLIGLDFDKVAGLTPPRTVDDLIHMATRGCAVAP